MSQKFKVAFFAIVAAQMVLLLAMIGVKEYTLRTGTTVVLQTVPVDPRSLLQGDFVILQYKIATLPAHFQSGTRKLSKGTAVYVELTKGQEVWEAKRYLMFELRQAEAFIKARVQGEVVIKGRVDDSGRLDFGMGTYFVPEGTGRIIERARDIKVKASVNSQGNAVIKEIVVDGEPFSPGSQ